MKRKHRCLGHSIGTSRKDLVHAAGCTYLGVERCIAVDCVVYQEPGDFAPGTRIPRSLRKYFGGRARV